MYFTPRSGADPPRHLSISTIPPTALGSQLYGIDGQAQVGASLDSNGGQHAAVWTGTAASETRLDSWGATYSVANGVSRGQLVGQGSAIAIDWSGKAHLAAALPCNGCGRELATGIYHSAIVGWGNLGGYPHALFWPTSATNAIDINPQSVLASFAFAVHGNTKVGYTLKLNSHGNTIVHAAVWLGPASHYADLNKYLPPGYGDSSAQGIDEKGNIVGVAIDATKMAHAIIWAKQ